MPLRPGQSFYAQFTTASPSTGAAVNADSLPAAVLSRNGSDDGDALVTITNVASARYVCSGAIPSGYGAGDAVDVVVTATVEGVTGKSVVASYLIDPTTSYGSTAVDQDWNGAGTLTVQDSQANPVQGATVSAYLASLYAANPLTAPVVAQTLTNSAGGWTLYLNSGTYTVVASKAGDTSAMGTVVVT